MEVYSKIKACQFQIMFKIKIIDAKKVCSTPGTIFHINQFFKLMTYFTLCAYYHRMIYHKQPTHYNKSKSKKAKKQIKEHA